MKTKKKMIPFLVLGSVILLVMAVMTGEEARVEERMSGKNILSTPSVPKLKIEKVEKVAPKAVQIEKVIEGHEDHEHDHDEFGNLPKDCQESIRVAAENAKHEDNYYDDEEYINPEVLEITQKHLDEFETYIELENGAVVTRESLAEQFEMEVEEFEAEMNNGSIAEASDQLDI